MVRLRQLEGAGIELLGFGEAIQLLCRAARSKEILGILGVELDGLLEGCQGRRVIASIARLETPFVGHPLGRAGRRRRDGPGGHSERGRGCSQRFASRHSGSLRL